MEIGIYVHYIAVQRGILHTIASSKAVISQTACSKHCFGVKADAFEQVTLEALFA